MLHEKVNIEQGNGAERRNPKTRACERTKQSAVRGHSIVYMSYTGNCYVPNTYYWSLHKRWNTADKRLLVKHLSYFAIRV